MLTSWALFFTLLGVCVCLPRDLSQFTPGRPTNVGNPLVRPAAGGVPSFQRPQVDPRPIRTGRSAQTKPVPRPQRPQTLPAPLPIERSDDLPPASELTKPVPRPYQRPQTLPAIAPARPQTVPAVSPARPQTVPAVSPAIRTRREEFAPLPEGPIVEPRPSPSDLTRPVPRPHVQPSRPPPRPHVQPTPPPGHKPSPQ
ncbi:hypothetical protein Pcinc_028589 [Petrolisthes cinctipes]|uniref:Uncharacterized protein n=1 Tax=Petrolisthes cinctipes TaxID=88211 RepID=A0AAE1F2R8_PETCI|nr:hypothetical protein Pcinc_028589 [Petrolisthes cinctipes]